MKKILVLASILLLSAVGAKAQTALGYPGINWNGGAWLSAFGADQTTVVGTLSEMGGNYNLVDRMGTAYRLIGHTTGLRGLVGDRIQVTGISTMNSASNLEGEQVDLSVIDYKRING